MEATHPEMRAAVDVLAGSYISNHQWQLAHTLYGELAHSLNQSTLEERRSLAGVMLERMNEVTLSHERVLMSEADFESKQLDTFARNPSLVQDAILGRTLGQLSLLLNDSMYCSATARNQFKHYIKSESLRDALAFCLAINDFNQTNPTDPAFMHAARRIYKGYIRPVAKLPMLTQSIRMDIKESLHTPTKLMFKDAHELTVKTIFEGAYKKWIETDDGLLWLKCRQVSLSPHLTAIIYFQVKVRADQAISYQERKRAKAGYLAMRASRSFVTSLRSSVKFPPIAQQG